VVILESIPDDLPCHVRGNVQAGGIHPAAVPIILVVIDAHLSSPGSVSPGGPSEVVERFELVDRFSIIPVVILESIPDDLPCHGRGSVQAGGIHPAAVPIFLVVIDAL